MSIITEIKAADALEPTSRENINDNFTALNADKIEDSDIVDNEAVGTGDNSAVDFTLDNTPIAGSVHVLMQGVRQILSDDYTISGTTITFAVAPFTGAKITADYRK